MTRRSSLKSASTAMLNAPSRELTFRPHGTRSLFPPPRRPCLATNVPARLPSRSDSAETPLLRDSTADWMRRCRSTAPLVRRRSPPDRARACHRTTRLAALQPRRILARPDLGALDRADRGRAPACRTRQARRRDQPPVPNAVRDVGLRRELRCGHRHRTTRSRVHLDRRQLPAARPRRATPRGL